MKTMQGTVIRVIDPKTVKVEVSRSWQHPLYKKYVKRTKYYLCGMAEGLEVAVGEEVSIEACRPLSKTKHFMVVGKGETTLA
jgi:small subunit ribosomal protein S17